MYPVIVLLWSLGAVNEMLIEVPDAVKATVGAVGAEGTLLVVIVYEVLGDVGPVPN